MLAQFAQCLENIVIVEIRNSSFAVAVVTVTVDELDIERLEGSERCEVLSGRKVCRIICRRQRAGIR